GKETRPVLSASDPSGPHDPGPRPSWQQKEVERNPLHKMYGMAPHTALVWLPNEEVPRVSRIKGYFEIPQLNARADANPYYRGPAKPAQARAGRGQAGRFAALAVLLLLALSLFGLMWDAGKRAGARPGSHHRLSYRH